MKRLSSIVAALALAVGLSGAAYGQKHYVLSLSTWGSPKHPQVTQFVPMFVKLVEQRSHGQITFKVFQGGELVKEKFVSTAIPQDVADISLSVLERWSSRVPDFEILGSPLWTWPMTRTLTDMVPGRPVFDYLNKQLKGQGAIMLAALDIGPPVLVTNFKVRKPSDLKGHTIRVYSRGTAQIVQTLGGAPATIGVGEVYTALQRGTVDGAIGGLGGAVGLKYYEVAKNIFSPMGVLGSLVNGYVMNEQKFDSLPPNLQKVIIDSANDARNHAEKELISIYSKQLKQVRKAGKDVYALKPQSELWTQWHNAIEPLIEKAKSEYPKQLVNMLH